MGKKARKPTTAPAEESMARGGVEHPERWSVQRKTEVVLRLLRGGTRGLKTRAEPEERELTLTRAKIGELMMRLELAEHLIEKRGSRTRGRGLGGEAHGEPDHRPGAGRPVPRRQVNGRRPSALMRRWSRR